MLQENLRCHPAISAVVAKTNQYRDALHALEAHHFVGSCTSSTAHQLGDADTLFRKAILDGFHVLDVQDWLHDCPP